MKIAIFSDSHLGYGSGTERAGDAFEAFSESLEKSLDSDIILLAGDIFDNKTPNTETLARTMELLIKPKIKPNQVKILQGQDKELRNLSPLALSGVPVVAIHGTHERRTKEMLNPVEALEKAGFLLYLHCNGVVLEKNNEKVCIQGMGGVPDQYAQKVLKEWDPKPVPGCVNIFMLHQSLKGFVNAPHTLDLEDLPKGFDLYVCGHLHGSKTLEEPPLVLPGSLIPTQLNKEAMEPNGLWFFDTETRGLEFMGLERKRPFYYFDCQNREEAEERIRAVLEEDNKIKPIVRVNLKGENSGFVKDMETKYGERVILFFKTEKEADFTSRSIDEQRLSVQELGQKLLRENLQKAGLDPSVFENVFELLLEKKDEEAVKLLREAAKNSYGKENREAG